MLQEWSGFVNWIHTELSESKQELTQTQETVCKLQETIKLQQVI